MWRYTRYGSGPPLVLLHGIGMSHAVWRPLRPHLGAHREVYAFDIAGFGASPPLPEGTAPTIAHLVDALESSIRDLGLTCPIDLAGNSLGGTLALEAARRGIARRVVAISPAGLWRSTPPAHVKYVFRGCRFLATHGHALLATALRSSVMRELLLSVPLSIGSRRMPYEDALRTIDDLASATTFDETFENTGPSFAARDIAVPVTVVFGNRDFILTKRARSRRALPDHARWLTIRGWGHVPMWADPAGVAKVILDGLEQGS